MKKEEVLKRLLEFFQNQGRVLSRTEYSSLGMEAPVPGRLLKRYFRGRSYPQVIRSLYKAYPVEMANLGSVPVEEEPVQAWEEPISPLEMLRKESNE